MLKTTCFEGLKFLFEICILSIGSCFSIKKWKCEKKSVQSVAGVLDPKPKSLFYQHNLIYNNQLHCLIVLWKTKSYECSNGLYGP